ILQQAWPFVGQYLEKLLVETIAPAIRASSIHLQTLNFTKVNLGEKVAMSDTMIMDAIASHLVLPNRLTIPLVADLHVAQLRSPLPRVNISKNIVRIHLLEAEDLTAKDTVIKGLIDGKSDPYAVLRVGTQIFTSHHVDNNLNPQWREMYEWFNLRDVPSGSVHLRLEWLSLMSSADRLSEVIQKNQNLTAKTADPPSAAILAVYLDQAYELPVKDDDRAFPLGSLTIPLSRLLESHELTLDQWFHLENPGLASRLYAKIVLRVLWLSDDASPTTPSPPPSGSGSGLDQGEITSNQNSTGPGGQTKPLPSRPQNTTPDPEFATQGVLRIHLVEAQNLIAKDNFMGGMVKGKSDPYVKIRVAGITFRSHTIKENLNPVWNELYEVILTQLPGQEIQFELFDKDIDQDDFLGRFKLNLRDIISAQFNDTWYTLNDVKSGRVHLVMEWLPRVTDLPRLEQVLQYQSQQSYQNKVVPSAAVLFVYVERAHGLPLKKNGKEPKAGVEITLKNVSYKTKICERSTSPRWDEACHFLVRDPRDETFTVKLSHSWGQTLGSLTVLLREVLSEPGLMLDKWFSLDGALPESQILLRVTLK
ncbi:hypothetical protein GOODEAATRI_017690, partial [Goodea atripinnis]